MALDSPEAYEKLAEHLEEIDPLFQEFLRTSGYKDNTGALGRYPHRTAILRTDIIRKIDLQMDDDKETGERFAAFHPRVPYSLWAGAWVDRDGKRYCPDQGVLVFERLPFVEMVPKLSKYLMEALAVLRPYTQAEIIAQSKPFRIG